MDCQEDLNLCFIDYAKAFDRVNHEKLMEVLAKAEIQSHETIERRLVCEIYWNQWAKVKLTSGTTEDIMIQRGVRQGYILSPSLFNLYSEYLLQKAISKKSGILINGVNINNFRYADDTVILAGSEEKLQAILDRIVDKCKEYGMEINAKKTKTMHIGKNTKTLTITVGNQCSSRSRNIHALDT
ncbi:retrovirus-related Pol polyprotein LINE-1 [Elysia marginata]|uniref:Retrovirus-related Pol polyprotein LINE-1 n=1 Tax=Elysia marginata TaxID=1093978 RepID=A0AAV4I6I1_9GAST|nr:retrovirus-related Pol polyprotein LINE-1 [Elysia marginata]